MSRAYSEKKKEKHLTFRRSRRKKRADAGMFITGARAKESAARVFQGAFRPAKKNAAVPPVRHENDRPFFLSSRPSRLLAEPAVRAAGEACSSKSNSGSRGVIIYSQDAWNAARRAGIPAGRRFASDQSDSAHRERTNHRGPSSSFAGQRKKRGPLFCLPGRKGRCGRGRSLFL